MAASLSEIRSWFQRGQANPRCTHMIVVCDTFDWEDYPVFVTDDQDVHEVEKQHNGPNMQKVMEVYCMTKPLDPQLKATRSLTY